MLWRSCTVRVRRANKRGRLTKPALRADLEADRAAVGRARLSLAPSALCRHAPLCRRRFLGRGFLGRTPLRGRPWFWLAFHRVLRPRVLDMDALDVAGRRMLLRPRDRSLERNRLLVDELVMERARFLMLPDRHHRALGLSVLVGRVDDKAGGEGMKTSRSPMPRLVHESRVAI